MFRKNTPTRGPGQCCAGHTAQLARLLLLYTATSREATMLWTIVLILLVLWLLGMVSGATLGGLVHILLVIAIIVILVRVIQGRRPI